MKRPKGRCSICGCESELTFEHIPPRMAFNSRPARPVSGEEIFKEEYLCDDNRMPWDTSGMHYENQQQGMGKYSLCQKCNNNTGHWYGDSYVRFARTVHDVMGSHLPEDSTAVVFKGVYPLRLIKQILAMFCSLASLNDPKMEDIRRFVLDKNAVGIDKTKYKLCMYFTNTMCMKYSGVTVKMCDVGGNIEVMVMMEVTAYPLGFILYFDPTETWKYKGLDITECADYEYEDIAEITFPWKIMEMNDIYPESFRSKEEIRECVRKNREITEA